MINENLNFNNIEDEEPGFDFKTIIMKLFIYWKWILLSIIVCLGCAYVYLQMQTPVYRVSGRIMIPLPLLYSGNLWEYRLHQQICLFLLPDNRKLNQDCSLS